MENGVLFVKNNFEKVIEICKRIKPNLLKTVHREYMLVSSIRYTGNLIEYFDRYKDYHAKHAKDFVFLSNEGAIPNELMADKLKLLFPNEVNHAITVDNIRKKDIISHYELLAIYKGNRQGLFRENKQKGTIALVLNDYYNQFNSSNTVKVLLGKNNTTTKSRFKKLTSSNRRYKIYIFKKKETNKYEYLGKGKYISYYENSNQYWLTFEILENVDTKTSNNWDFHPISLETINKAKYLDEPDDNELSDKAKSVTNKRDKTVAEFTKNRANNTCDLCEKKGPFKYKDKEGYFLECHHIIQVGAYGPDRIYNTVALCPNCHRRIHHLQNESDKAKLIAKLRNYLENDNDLKNLMNFKKLFGV